MYMYMYILYTYIHAFIHTYMHIDMITYINDRQHDAIGPCKV
jgi:hypothetical protein